jgi:hypothetical protein
MNMKMFKRTENIATCFVAYNMNIKTIFNVAMIIYHLVNYNDD